MTFIESTQARSDAEVQELAELLAALSHPVRLRIVEGLLSGECAVGNMVHCLGLPQPLVSRHLAVLRRAGVVRADRQGRVRSYRVVHPAAHAVLRCLSEGANASQDSPISEERAS
ncbi:MAG: winged helix-turn-helix transcriptional regulator [Deltaproteobacteria bacterium]|jgi:ArsR family transcriptional regulator|nr:winged helix-turn-helix transcriptional regulator [Deltaproteobacteria bacterium]MBW2537045.1 winged helix-turn-helix transcriptional regulator [Deltaproteobacteria bacterium]